MRPRPIARFVLLTATVTALSSASLSLAQAWEESPGFPDPTEGRLHAAGLNLGSTLYAIGGSPWVNGGDMDGSVHALPLGASMWTVEAPLGGMGPVIGQGAGVDALNRIIVFGGINLENGDPGEGKIYIPGEGPTDTIADRGSAAPDTGFAWCTDGQGRIYSLGGGPGESAGPVTQNSAYAERYDSINDRWDSIAPLLTPTADAAAVYDGQGHILVLGGFDAAATTRLANVARYDIAHNTWSDTAVPDLPIALSGLRAVLGADGRVYAIGGMTGPVGSGTVEAGVYVLDVTANTWSTGPSMILPRQAFAAALSGDHYIYAMGGDDGAGGTWRVERLYTPPCPVITQPPESLAAWRGQTLALTASAEGGTPLTFGWRKDGGDLSDGPASGGGTISGTSTTTLVITAAQSADAGEYTFVASNPCGETVSAAAVVTVQAPPEIPSTWMVTNLHPAWALWSRANSIAGGQQGGACGLNVDPYGVLDQAVLWNGSAASAVNLTPPGSPGSSVSAVAGGVQVGWWWWPYQCWISGQWHTCHTRQACAWAGTPGSYDNLQVTGYEYSLVSDTDGSVHVGTVTTDDASGNVWSHAGMWRPPSYGFVSLHPAGASSSFASAIDGNRQFGSMHTPFPGPQVHAAAWAGTAGSFMDMHPPGASSSSIAGAGSGLQVGSAKFAGSDHAVLWAGLPVTFQDLHPAGASSSTAHDTQHGLQVGTAVIGGKGHALIWTGSANGPFDLHPTLSSDFQTSQARGIDFDAQGHILIVGSGYNITTGREEALLWRSEPHVSPDLNHDGHVDSSDFDLFTDCATGPALAYVPGQFPVGCTLGGDVNGRIAADLDADGDVDQSDFGVFQRCYSGADDTPQLSCEN